MSDVAESPVPPSQEGRSVVEQIKDCTLDSTQFMSIASELENTGRPEIAVEFYKVWLANNDDPHNWFFWFKYGSLLINQANILIAEQALLNSIELNREFEAANVLIREESLQHLFRNAGVVRTVFMQARYGSLSIGFLRWAQEHLGAPEMFELYRLWIQKTKTKLVYSHWFELATIAAKLDYRGAARQALKTALQLKPDFELAQIALEGLDGGLLIPSLLAQLSLHYTDDTAKVLKEIASAVGGETASRICASWLEHTLSINVPYACYNLGADLKRQGNIIEAQMAFARSLDIYPHFGRARFAMGPDVDAGTIEANTVAGLAAIDAKDIEDGKIAAARVPSRTSPRLVWPEPLIVRAPHLYRLLVRFNLQIIDARRKLAELTDPDSYEYRCEQERIRIAGSEISCITNKLASMVEDGKRTVAPQNQRAALLLLVKGNGDHIYLHGAARFLATKYDVVHVGTMYTPPAGILEMFRDDPAIQWRYFNLTHFTDGDTTNLTALMEACCGMDVFYADDFYFFQDSGTERGMSRLPETAYERIGIDPEVAVSYFHVQEYDEGDTMLRIAQAVSPRFIFSHTVASESSWFNITERLRDENPDMLVINPDQNPYPPGHRFHDAAQHFLGRPLFWYIQTMSNAQELHLVDSSFFAMSHYIPRIEGQKVVCYARAQLLRYLPSGAVFPNYEYVELAPGT